VAEVEGDRHRLRVPPLWCPIAPALNPAWRQMHRSAVAWMERFGLAADEAQARRLVAIGAGELGARVTAGAVDVDHAQFAADHLLWLFAFDDTFCDEGAFADDPARMALLVADLLRTAETGQPRSDLPITVALADLRRRLDRLGSPVQAARWVSALCAYLFYQVWEAGHRASRTTPDLTAYLVARISNGSMPVCVAWLDIANGYEVPGDELHRPQVRWLSEMCCAMVGFDNDIMSHWKETLRTRDGINLVDTLASQRRLPPGKVLAEAIALRDRVLARYVRLRDETVHSVSAPTRRYLSDLDAWIRGNLDWGMNSRRYRNPTDPADLPNTAVAQRPTCTDPTPLPGIAEWWPRPATGATLPPPPRRTRRSSPAAGRSPQESRR
jgi:Terpene synthase family 2, C-terminal metal binding